MIYYSLQNKKTKKLIKTYVTPFNDGVYDVSCYVLSITGVSPWLVSKEDAEKALKAPNYSSKSDADYDTPYNWLETSEWKVVEVTLNIKDPVLSVAYFNSDYWDCECEHGYIHPKSEHFCTKCRALQEDQPDSIASEVKTHLDKKSDKTHMTSAQYCNHSGAMCPYCRSVDIDVIDGFEVQDSVTYQPAKCNECGKCWTDIRGLIGYEECNKHGLLK